MSYFALLIGNDNALADRVRRALPTQPPLQLVCRPAPAAAPDGRPWLLVMIDSRGQLDEQQVAAAAALPAGARIWLHDPRAGAAPPFRAGIVDCLDREAANSKFNFVLRQQLSAAYLRRLRGRAPARLDAGAGREGERRNLANLLTALLGNAELALSGGGRVPAPLRARLQRIVTLTDALRELLAA